MWFIQSFVPFSLFWIPCCAKIESGAVLFMPFSEEIPGYRAKAGEQSGAKLYSKDLVLDFFAVMRWRAART